MHLIKTLKRPHLIKLEDKTYLGFKVYNSELPNYLESKTILRRLSLFHWVVDVKYLGFESESKFLLIENLCCGPVLNKSQGSEFCEKLCWKV